MFTKHAEIRCKQRSIPNNVLNILIDYGQCGRHRGADVYYMDKTSREIAKTALGSETYNQVADKLNSFIVVGDDGMVITAAKRTTRLKFH